MTILRKSNDNMSVAQFMDDEGYYASSVHTSYYGSFLLVKHFICNRLSIGYQKQKENSKGKDSHKYLMECMKNDLHNKSAKDENKFLMNFNALRRNRRKADYLNNDIDKPFADDSLSRSFTLRKELANIYSITI